MGALTFSATESSTLLSRKRSSFLLEASASAWKKKCLIKKKVLKISARRDFEGCDAVKIFKLGNMCSGCYLDSVLHFILKKKGDQKSRRDIIITVV